ncbi:21166_t:CDS:1, partial [Dentiscutata erythropus]
MSVKTIESYFNNTQNSSKSINNRNQTNNKLKNRQKKNPVPIHNYLEMLEDGTRICKVCDKDKGVVGKWGPLTSLMPIMRYFEQKHPNTFKVFGKFAAKL